MAETICEDRREADARAIRARILNVLPAATYQMDRFLQFVDVVLSERTETACVEVGPQPRLHLNADFVRQRCQRDEHLLMLVLHELYHVILGHTRLFPRLTVAHNIAFDAVINSMLCRQFPDAAYVSFFTKLNGARQFPGRLLRPPTGWPRSSVAASDASAQERALMTLLYGPNAGTATYREILDLLGGKLGASIEDCARRRTGSTREDTNKSSRHVLLGDHGRPSQTGEFDDAAVSDPVVKEVLRRVTEKWPPEAGLRVSRGDNRTPLDFLMPAPKTPRTAFLEALRSLLAKAGITRPGVGGPYAWEHLSVGLETTTALPDWRDRHAHSRFALTGAPPLLFRSEVTMRRRRWRPQSIAHVYLDISGSMSADLPWLAGAFAPVLRRGLCRLFVFSTLVEEIRPGHLLGSPMRNTGGTDIRCVYEHFLGVRPTRTPRRVVVITDGWTGEPSATQAADAIRRKVRLFVGLIAGGTTSELEKHAAATARLPAYR